MTSPAVTNPFNQTPDQYDAWVHDLTTLRRSRPSRREPVRPSPRCPVCDGFIRRGPGELATRYENGVECHRVCLRDAA